MRRPLHAFTCGTHASSAIQVWYVAASVEQGRGIMQVYMGNHVVRGHCTQIAVHV
jgi:hypothetical protein